METPIVINLFSIFPLLFTIYLAKRHLPGSRQNGYYITSAFLTVLLLLLQVAITLARGKTEPEAVVALHLSYTLAFSLTPAIPLVILFYLGYSDLSSLKITLLTLPLGVNILCAILSMQTGWFFFIDELNFPHWGKLYWITTLVSVFYYAFVLIRLIKIREKSIVPSKFLLSMVYLLPLFSTFIQIATQRETYIFSTISVSLLLYYVIVQEAKFDYDLQTKVRNREAFEQEMISLGHEKRDVAMIMVDVNNLKQTNDTWGHQEGDSLLHAVASLLAKLYEPEGKVFRIGGDEFCVLLPLPRKRKIEQDIIRLEKRLEEENKGRVHPINIAYGCAISNQQQEVSLPMTFNLADDAMYRNKAMQKDLSIQSQQGQANLLIGK
ncbi:MAG: GGDEF domain-containing protein [Sphaerochaeta sp.]|uniref:GGDEF domain-containing protein n=1 Tax=Sphaerochaeta sp. TaxID=1972642 RepID=UPI002FC7D423